ncbi:MAG: hypothetical protein KC414_05985 [Romboutsia sp.]|nr:hypothetical protein [Romboutsia sp.]
MENKLVYFDPSIHVYVEIGHEYVTNSDEVVEYFGENAINYMLDNNGELIFYKLVPYARVKKNYKLNISTDEDNI